MALESVLSTFLLKDLPQGKWQCLDLAQRDVDKFVILRNYNKLDHLQDFPLLSQMSPPYWNKGKSRSFAVRELEGCLHPNSILVDISVQY